MFLASSITFGVKLRSHHIPFQGPPFCVLHHFFISGAHSLVGISPSHPNPVPIGITYSLTCLGEDTGNDYAFRWFKLVHDDEELLKGQRVGLRTSVLTMRTSKAKAGTYRCVDASGQIASIDVKVSGECLLTHCSCFKLFFVL